MQNPGASRPDVKIPKTDWSAYSPPQAPVTTPVEPDDKAFSTDRDNFRAFAAPAVPEGFMPAPVLPVGGYCQHPFGARWYDSASALEGCTACGRTLTPGGWSVVEAWQQAAAAR